MTTRDATSKGTDRRGLAPGAVVLSGATKVYESNPKDLGWRAALPCHEPTWTAELRAVDGVDLRIDPGETIGVIGPNGAGKTTMLRMIAGITQPTRGTVRHGGVVGAMIELGLGFHPDLTGNQNLELSGALHGLTGAEMDAVLPAIVAFSGLSDGVLREPLRAYSRGMRARLGFALATHIPADILVVDEVLVVGDREFQQQCLERIGHLVEGGTTVVLVTHGLPLVTQVCRRAVQMRGGTIVDDGPAEEVVERYLVSSSSRFRPAPDRWAQFRSCDTPRPVLRPWDPLEVVAEVDVRGEAGRMQVGVDLMLPTFAPDHVFRSSLCEVGVPAPGRYRLHGVSTPFPGSASDIRAAITLVDPARRSLVDRRDIDFQVVGTTAWGKPHLEVTPTWKMEPIAGPDAAMRRRSTAGGGPAVISIRGLTKRYPAHSDDTSFTALLPRATLHPSRPHVTAVDDVDLDVERGSSLGVIGSNGAGKTTLLRLLAGVTRPDDGQILSEGRLIPLLDLGLGFHPELTGRENLEVSSRLLGMTAPELHRVLDQLVDFSGVGWAMDLPVGRYSSGMRARLGLSLALHSRPDVLLIDELLAVGDAEFRRQSISAIRELRDDGVAIVFVSHELQLVEEICDRVIRLDRGRLVDDGSPSEVVGRYGGSAWVAGAWDAGSALRVHALHVAQRHIEPGGSLSCSGMIEVESPNPHARVELSFRIPPEDRSLPLGPDEVLAQTNYIVTVEPAGGALSSPGWYRFHATVAPIHFIGEVDLVISVVDGLDHLVLSESWEPIKVGSPRAGAFPEPFMEFTWDASRVDRPDGPDAAIPDERNGSDDIGQ